MARAPRAGGAAALASSPRGPAALELQPGAVGGRALGRLRVGGGQPQLRQALRADERARPRPAARPASRRRQPPARRSASRVGLQPDDLGRRPARRVRDLPAAGRSESALDVVVRDMRTGALARVRPPAGAGDASTSRGSRADGRRIAFTVARALGRRRALRGLRPGPAPAAACAGVRGAATRRGSRSLSARRVRASRSPRRPRRRRIARRRARPAHAVARTAIASPAGSRPAFEPSLSARRAAAWRSSPRAGGRAAHAGLRRATSRSGAARARLARATAPAARPRMGSAVAPGDLGRRAPGRLHLRRLEPRRPAKCNTARGVFVRDLGAGRTRLVERRRRRQPLPRADEGLEHRAATRS